MREPVPVEDCPKPRTHKELMSLIDLRDSAPQFIRAGAGMICPECGKEYRKHPNAKEHLDWQGHPYLRRLCNGKLVKL